jgi:hypothetical protein
MLSPRTLFNVLLWAPIVYAAIKSSEDSSAINISNDRLSFSVAKGIGSVSKLWLDGQNLLGTGRGPYLIVTLTVAFGPQAMAASTSYSRVPMAPTKHMLGQ